MTSSAKRDPPKREVPNLFPMGTGPKKEPAPKKARAIDTLLEEMKAMRGGVPASETSLNDHIRAYEGANMTALDDPNTTNLYVGNISSQVSEEVLYKEFGKFGRISSVKIMWPRTEEEKTRPRNCGFVSFHDRTAAEKCKDALDGLELMGAELRIGWSKPVKAAGVPMVLAPDAAEKVQMALRLGPSGGLGFSGGPTRTQAPRRPEPSASGEIVQVVVPEASIKATIDRVASYVRRYGYEFETALMEKEHKNATYEFLFNLESAAHTYYRWRAYSLAQGDTVQAWRTEPFVMVEGGPSFVPPPLDSKVDPKVPKVDPKDLRRDDDRERRRDRSPDVRRDDKEADRVRTKQVREVTLSDTEYDELSDVLRSLTISRADIAKGMAFALDHADAGKEIVQTIAESLTLDSTQASSKMARLYLVSDILHNSQSGVKNASNYRTMFQASLKDVLKSFGNAMKASSGRITALALEDQVMKVLEVWDRWSLYPSHFIQELVALFRDNPPPVKSLPKEEDVDGEPLDGEPMDDIDGEALDGDPIDGEDIDGEDMDGEPMDGAPMGAAGPDLRRLPLNELVKLCQQQGLASHGTQEQLVQRLTGGPDARGKTAHADSKWNNW